MPDRFQEARSTSKPEFPKLPQPSFNGHMERNPVLTVLIFRGTIATLILAAIVTP